VKSLIFLLAVAASAAAQQKPDFSGEWVLNRQASTLSPAASAMESGVLRIEHREPVFHYKAALVSGGSPVQYEYELTTDGKEGEGAQQGSRAVSSLHWEGDVLVLSSRIERGDAVLTISFRHELLDGGRRLRETERLRGMGRDQDNVWIFDRR